jgi:hypothetical protein
MSHCGKECDSADDLRGCRLVNEQASYRSRVGEMFVQRKPPCEDARTLDAMLRLLPTLIATSGSYAQGAPSVWLSSTDPLSGRRFPALHPLAAVTRENQQVRCE